MLMSNQNFDQKLLFVAVHIGCGNYKNSKEKPLKDLIKQACRVAMDTLLQKKSSNFAVSSSISVLEDSSLTNAGFGSNLTYEGKVECDASIMDGIDGSFSAIGAVSGVKNPIQLAYQLLTDSKKGNLSLGRIRPL